MDRIQQDRLLAAQLSRRGFLIKTGALAGLTVVSHLPLDVRAGALLGGYPFTLGVASGDPTPSGIVLWTRLAPDPLAGGGMPPEAVPVRWQIATDEHMRKVVQHGTVLATPDLAHSVHVDVDGLEPDRWYWYQFQAGTETSPIGRTRTLPSLRSRRDVLRFAFVSCQDWQNGYYPAYKRLAEEDLDLVIHLGDYIYEYGPEAATGPRQHDGPEVESLASYRNRHALYKTDTNLQAAHAAFPWLVTWDDHEVDNNYANDIPEDGQTREAFLQRRANAYQAYYEHMPLRRSSLPVGADLRLYRRLTWGRLAEFNLLDTRQYRTDQPCGDGLQQRCAAALAESATMTGPEQERWLLTGLDRSSALWNVVAQQTMFAQYDFLAGPGQEGGPSQLFNMDQWDGYVAARNRMLSFIQQRHPSNVVVITGDIHSSWVHDVKADFANPASTTLATEFVGTSISSDFPAPFIAPVQAALTDNPHTKFFDGAFRGYVRCTLNRTHWQSDFRVVPTILTEGAPVSTLASFVVTSGRAGAERA